MISQPGLNSDARFIRIPSGAIALGRALAMLAVIVGIWAGVSRGFHVPDWMLPTPVEVFQRFITDWRSWMSDTGVTLLESVLGFGLGGGIGFVMGVVFAHSRLLENLFYPYAIALKTIPLVALAPILAIWFPNGLASKVIMGAIITFFPCIVNTVMGLRAPSREMLDLMSSLAATRSQVFWKLRLPAALPSIFSALKISSTLAVIGAIVAEMAGAQAGLGYQLLQADQRTDMTTTVVAVLLASFAGMFFFGVVSLAESRALYWIPPERR